MSGGVDSSVAACLLLEQGFEVIGSHMNLVHLDGVEHGCCGPSARRDAAEVARIAGIPFEICDLSEPFAARVVDDFVAEHREGRTPNPCARCNGEIKFGAFLRRADELGADLVATGTTCGAGEGTTGDGTSCGAPTPRRTRPTCCTCWARPSSTARGSRWGGWRSPRPVPSPNAGACRSRRSPIPKSCASLPQGTPVRSCVGRPPNWCVPAARSSTETAGFCATHDGTFAFTVGQRRGLGVALGEPAYVLGVDAVANRVLVGPQALLSPPRSRRRPGIVDRGRTALGCTVRGRGPHPVPRRGRAGRRRALAEGFRVEFRTRQRAVAPGQSAVVYRGEELLGGGRIVEAFG